MDIQKGACLFRVECAHTERTEGLQGFNVFGILLVLFYDKCW